MRNANKTAEISYSAVVREVEKWFGIRISSHNRCFGRGNN